MFSGSSGIRRGVNPDGSQSIYCTTCQRFICRAMTSITKATCEMCRRAESGEPITVEAMRAYELAKMGKADVGLLVLPEEPPGFKAKFSFRSMGAEILQAVGITKPTEEPAKSTALAKEKRRGRLFEHAILGEPDQPQQQSGLGSIQELDAKLQEPPK